MPHAISQFCVYDLNHLSEKKKAMRVLLFGKERKIPDIN